MPPASGVVYFAGCFVISGSSIAATSSTHEATSAQTPEPVSRSTFHPSARGTSRTRRCEADGGWLPVRQALCQEAAQNSSAAHALSSQSRTRDSTHADGGHVPARAGEQCRPSLRAAEVHAAVDRNVVSPRVKWGDKLRRETAARTTGATAEFLERGAVLGNALIREAEVHLLDAS